MTPKKQKLFNIGAVITIIIAILNCSIKEII